VGAHQQCVRDFARAQASAAAADSARLSFPTCSGLASGWNLDLSTLDDFRLVMEVNFFGMVRMTKGLLPLLKRSRGRVINVASIAGRVAPPAMMPYTCSKFAVEAFSQALRADMWRWGVRVAVVEPGFMRTALTLQAATVVQRAWECAPAEVRAEYGEEVSAGSARASPCGRIDPAPPPRQFFASSMERVAVVRDRALQDPALVVATLCDAVWSRVPKHKYLVGRDARVLAALAWLLPEWCTTWMLYAFNRPAVPAALKRARDGQ
jgi:retinol dehydrogenase-16